TSGSLPTDPTGDLASQREPSNLLFVLAARGQGLAVSAGNLQPRRPSFRQPYRDPLGHGHSSELWAILDAGHPRFGADGGGFYPRRRCAEYRLGVVTGAGWRHRRPSRSACHDDDWGGYLYRRA